MDIIQENFFLEMSEYYYCSDLPQPTDYGSTGCGVFRGDTKIENFLANSQMKSLNFGN